MEQGFVLFVELFPSTGVLWVIGVRLHISILLNFYGLLIYRPPVLSASRCTSESRRYISINRCTTTTANLTFSIKRKSLEVSINWKVIAGVSWHLRTYMYVNKTVSPIVVYILQRDSLFVGQTSKLVQRYLLSDDRRMRK